MSSDVLRWGLSAGFVLAVHAGILASVLALDTPPPPAEVAGPILIDLPPEPPPPEPAVEQPAPEPPPPPPEPPPPEPPPPEPPPPEPPPPEPEPIPEPPPPEPPPEEEPPPQVEPEVALPEITPPKPPRQKPPPPRPRPVEQPRPPEPAPPAPAPPPPAPAPVAEAEPAPARPRAVAQSSVMPSFQQRLLQHLNRHKRYPQSSQRMRQQGTALLRFTMDAEGTVLSYRLEKSSGYDALDEEVLEMIRRAQPLPKIPADLDRTSLELVVPVQFALR
ncbi:energy transducer TonB [Skermanella sp. TT6]|uniref:Energy transducer TonB n=1 Tax=Skermanella cutis TaxID=2775420 RepID=A0ABX7B1B7_9PROT|nr:energy transducer TonB [Skermanella sp. TT6]QQP87464.1 energy transducer TonB [Skermanella sp. TT6]